MLWGEARSGSPRETEAAGVDEVAPAGVRNVGVSKVSARTLTDI
jgi:hypothetical protein